MSHEAKQKVRILMVSGEDEETDPEIKAVKQVLKEHCPERSEVLTVQLKEVKDVLPEAERAAADIIHFCGYCDSRGYYYLVNSSKVQWDSRYKKATLLRQMSQLVHYPKMLYFNGHLKQDELDSVKKERIRFWICMETKWNREISLQFTPRLYEFLCEGYTFDAAFRKADNLLPPGHARPMFRFPRDFVVPGIYRLYYQSRENEPVLDEEEDKKSRIAYH